jgi:hypothetical protein
LFRVSWACLSLCKCRYNCTSYSRNPVLILNSFVAAGHSACVCPMYVYVHLQMNVTRKFVKSRSVCEYSIDVPSCIAHITDCQKFTFFFASFPCCSCSLPGCPCTSPHWNQLKEKINASKIFSTYSDQSSINFFYKNEDFQA